MNIFPVANSIFTDRATKRRVELRRIKKQYEKFADVNPVSEVDHKNIHDKTKFMIKTYSD
jgi:acetolactate synthase small subunit